MPRPKKPKTRPNKLERDLLEAATAMLEHEHTQSIAAINPVDVKQIRNHLHLTQEQFASFIGTSVHAVRHWESGRRTPSGTARTLLQVLNHNPRAVLNALSESPIIH